jgi:ABC-2 type transport system ATP-binding protein
MVANRFMFIDHGRVIKEISKEELDVECKRCIVVKSDDTKLASTMVEDKLGLTDYKVINKDELRIYDEKAQPGAINRLLVQNDVNVNAIYETGISLEDYFKTLVGEALA